MRQHLRRRDVLGLIAGAAGVAVFRLPALAGTDPLARVCLRAGRHVDLVELGRAWCAAHPAVRQREWLRQIADDLGSPPGSEADAVAALRARAAADFRAHRIVDLCGWRLSVTEARICAAGAAPA
jgi:hypothetical protein